MTIIITPEAGNYIARKDDHQAITIALAKRAGGAWSGRCVGDAHYPSVRLGKADQDKMHSYVQETIDGVSVYYLDRLPGIYKKITIKLEKLFFFEMLVAAGEK